LIQICRNNSWCDLIYGYRQTWTDQFSLAVGLSQHFLRGADTSLVHTTETGPTCASLIHITGANICSIALLICAALAFGAGAYHSRTSHSGTSHSGASQSGASGTGAFRLRPPFPKPYSRRALPQPAHPESHLLDLVRCAIGVEDCLLHSQLIILTRAVLNAHPKPVSIWHIQPQRIRLPRSMGFAS
jgi:hypothetical protein